MIAGQKKEGERERKLWYRRRESEKRGEFIYATGHCRLNVFLA